MCEWSLSWYVRSLRAAGVKVSDVTVREHVLSILRTLSDGDLALLASQEPLNKYDPVPHLARKELLRRRARK